MARCPVCEHEGPPVTTRQVSTDGWIVFAVLFFVCIFLCWIPFVVDGLKEDVHKCSNCGTRLGSG